MKVRYEAALHSYAEGTVTLNQWDEEEYRSLTTDEDRTAWLEDFTKELAHEGIYETYVDTVDWRIEDDDA